MKEGHHPFVENTKDLLCFNLRRIIDIPLDNLLPHCPDISNEPEYQMKHRNLMIEDVVVAVVADHNCMYFSLPAPISSSLSFFLYNLLISIRKRIHLTALSISSKVSKKSPP